MFEIFSSNCYDCSFIFFAFAFNFAWCEWLLRQKLMLGEINTGSTLIFFWIFFFALFRLFFDLFRIVILFRLNKCELALIPYICIYGYDFISSCIEPLTQHGRGNAWQILRDMVNEWAVRILLDCILVWYVTTGKKHRYLHKKTCMHSIRMRTARFNGHLCIGVGVSKGVSGGWGCV